MQHGVSAGLNKHHVYVLEFCVHERTRALEKEKKRQPSNSICNDEEKGTGRITQRAHNECRRTMINFALS